MLHGCIVLETKSLCEKPQEWCSTLTVKNFNVSSYTFILFKVNEIKLINIPISTLVN